MKRWVPLLTGLALILGAGFGHGVWTNRWSFSNEPQRSAAKVPSVAMHLGDWEGRELPPLEDEVLAMGQIAGYLNRAYVQADSQLPISVQILCGRPGPIVAHLPNICLGGEGYSQVGELQPYVHKVSSQQKVEFTVGQFLHTLDGGGTEYVRFFWTMSATGEWKSPRGWSGRLSFGKYPALYKVYLQRRVSSPDDPLDKDPLLQFTNFLMPELQKKLFSEQ
jgi:hypothetical protein